MLSGYAIDINGELVEGVVVEKEKARQVFETEARKEVSHKPTASIAEHVVGNVFKTRVFPIPKRGARTIRVTTVEEIDSSGTFWLLLGFGNNKIANYHFSVQVDSFGKAGPKIWDGHAATPRNGRPMSPLELSSKNNSNDRTRYRESFTSSEPTSPPGFILYLPVSPLVTIVEAAENKDFYFVVGGQFGSHASDSGSPNSLGNGIRDRVGIIWDTSLSRKSQAKNVDIEIVKLLAKKMASGAKIDIYPFSNTMGTPISITISGNSSNDERALERALQDLSYDGGTDLSTLKLTKGPTFEHTTDIYAFYCLFTDGMHNMSSKALPQALESPVYIFATSPEANSSLLKILARKSGGEFFKLSSSASTNEIRPKVDGLGKPSFSFLGVNIDSNIVSEVFPSIPTRVESSFRLCGKINAAALRGSATFVTLNFGYGSKITHSQSFQLTAQGAAFTSLVPRMWAQRKIDELTLFPEETENEKVILELGRQFSIVTPSTSIIVLEELEQYVKHDIEPPVALQAIRAKWLAIKQERANEQKAKEEEKIVSVLSLWNRRTAWWNEDKASSEAQERNHLHYLPFGEGIDLTSRSLASQWIDWEALNPTADPESDTDSGSFYSSNSDLDDGDLSRSDATGGLFGSDSESESDGSDGSISESPGSSSSGSCSDEEADDDANGDFDLFFSDTPLVQPPSPRASLERSSSVRASFKTISEDSKPLPPQKLAQKFDGFVRSRQAAPMKKMLSKEKEVKEKEEEKDEKKKVVFEEVIKKKKKEVKKDRSSGAESLKLSLGQPQMMQQSFSQVPQQMPQLQQQMQQQPMQFISNLSAQTPVLPTSSSSSSSVPAISLAAPRPGAIVPQAPVALPRRAAAPRPAPALPSPVNSYPAPPPPPSFQMSGPPPPPPQMNGPAPPPPPPGSIPPPLLGASAQSSAAEGGFLAGLMAPPPPGGLGGPMASRSKSYMAPPKPAAPLAKQSVEPAAASSLLSSIRSGSALKKVAEPQPVADRSSPVDKLHSNLLTRRTSIEEKGDYAEDEDYEGGDWDDESAEVSLEYDFLMGESTAPVVTFNEMPVPVPAPAPASEPVLALRDENPVSRRRQSRSEFPATGSAFGSDSSASTVTSASISTSNRFGFAPSSSRSDTAKGGFGSASGGARESSLFGGTAVENRNRGGATMARGGRIGAVGGHIAFNQEEDRRSSSRASIDSLASDYAGLHVYGIKSIEKALDSSLSDDLDGFTTLTPYVAPAVHLEYAYFEKIDPKAPVEYSKDLTPAPEFPAMDWDSVVYGNDPSSQSWKRWRERHREKSWAEYEQKAFGVGVTFMELFNQQRRLILESRIKSDFEAVEEENRKNRPLKNGGLAQERFRVALSKTTCPADESWNLELQLHSSASSAYSQYLIMRERPELAKLTRFYIDAADYFFDKLNDHKRAATILSNLAELELENPQFLRLIAFRLERAPEDPYLLTAIHLYRKILAIRGEEPQSYRDLAMALSRRALFLLRGLGQTPSDLLTASKKKKTLAESRPSYDRYSHQDEKRVKAEIQSLLEESVKLLNDVVLKKWDVRFAQVEVVALMDLNRIVSIIRSLNLEHIIGLSNLIDPRLYATSMPVDLRFQIQWDTDMTDVELTVTEPSGEKCNSIHNKTASGGMMSRDFTHGYGPVEYLTRYSDDGCYSASIKLFHALEMKSGTTVLVRVWTDYGRPGLEKEYFYIGRLNKAKQSLSVGNVFVSSSTSVTKA